MVYLTNNVYSDEELIEQTRSWRNKHIDVDHVRAYKGFQDDIKYVNDSEKVSLTPMVKAVIDAASHISSHSLDAIPKQWVNQVDTLPTEEIIKLRESILRISLQKNKTRKYLLKDKIIDNAIYLADIFGITKIPIIGPSVKFLAIIIVKLYVLISYPLLIARVAILFLRIMVNLVIKFVLINNPFAYVNDVMCKSLYKILNATVFRFYYYLFSNFYELNEKSIGIVNYGVCLAHTALYNSLVLGTSSVGFTIFTCVNIFTLLAVLYIIFEGHICESPDLTESPLTNSLDIITPLRMFIARLVSYIPKAQPLAYAISPVGNEPTYVSNEVVECVKRVVSTSINKI